MDGNLSSQCLILGRVVSSSQQEAKPQDADFVLCLLGSMIHCSKVEALTLDPRQSSQHDGICPTGPLLEASVSSDKGIGGTARIVGDRSHGSRRQRHLSCPAGMDLQHQGLGFRCAFYSPKIAYIAGANCISTSLDYITTARYSLRMDDPGWDLAFRVVRAW